MLLLVISIPIIMAFVVNGLTLNADKNENSLSSASLRGSQSIEIESVTYTPKTGYFLQMQHLATSCPPLNGRNDVTWANGIRIGKLSPYILDAAGVNQNLTLYACNSAKLNIQLEIGGFGLQTQQHCDATSYSFANGFQCVDNPYAYSDFSGVTQLAYSSATQCQINAEPVGFLTLVNGQCYNSAIVSCDTETSTVTTQTFSDSSCSTLVSSTTQTFSEYGMNKCNSDGLKTVCMVRAANHYSGPGRRLLEMVSNFIMSFF